jgi:hypothetical protein
MADNEQVEILKLIWGEMKALNQRIEGVRDELVAVRTELKAEIAAIRAELKADMDVLRRRMTESEIRVASAVTDLAGETRSLSSLIS